MQVPPAYRPTDPAPEHPEPGTTSPSTGTRVKRARGPVAGVGAFLAKFGAVLIKLKSLVVVGSMAVSVAAYASLWGWKFALGFVLLIFVHEMGHVVVLRARGIKAGWPVFLPFLGAFVSMKSMPQSVYQEAESALAGPIAGTAGALVVGYVAHARRLEPAAQPGFHRHAAQPVQPAAGAAARRRPGRRCAAPGDLAGRPARVCSGFEIYRPSPVHAPILLVLGGLRAVDRCWRGRDSEASKVYFALQPAAAAAGGGAAYVGLVVASS